MCSRHFVTSVQKLSMCERVPSQWNNILVIYYINWKNILFAKEKKTGAISDLRQTLKALTASAIVIVADTLADSTSSWFLSR